MPVSFENIVRGDAYTRPELALIWGYQSYEAISRGIVTPANTRFIILFITQEKQSFLTPYRDHLEGERLVIEGETNHAADKRIVGASYQGDEIHLFYRERHHSPFEYKGQAVLVAHEMRPSLPSHFEFSLSNFAATTLSDLETELLTHGAEIDSFVPDEEGRQLVRQSIYYERSIRNRARALEIHGTKCMACGFDFNAVYGNTHASNYIEVHHLRSIASGVSTPDPAADFATLCSNCHSMAHREKTKVLNVEELRSLIALAGAKLHSLESAHE